VPGSDELKAVLSGIFDTQIPNHGDYNLVFARARAGLRSLLGRLPACYVLGYRWRPHELVIAPVHPAGPAAGGMPIAIDMTNLSRVERLGRPAGGSGAYRVATSTGRSFRFGVAAVGLFPGGGSIEQARDAEDFHNFMDALIGLA
jgi:hypothetical protein